MHEELNRKTEIELGGERGFAWVFATVFALIALYPLLVGGSLRLWAVAISAGFVLAGWLAPQWLAPLNRLWFQFGLLLARIVNPLVLAIIFFLTVMPIGLLMRLFGKDPLKLAWQPEAESYWEPREPPGPEPRSLINQF